MPVSLGQTNSNVREQTIGKTNLYWYFGFFIVSGFCGLVYEVVWVRLAMASFGVTTALASIVISMFMAGLGFGSWGRGKLSRRFLQGNGRLALCFYAMAELLIGVSSIVVPIQLRLGRQLILHLGSHGAWQSSRYYILVAIWAALTLVPWCTCMGSTFPLLMTVIRQTDRHQSERSFSYLYVANVLGALAGTFASAFFLIELFGFQRTLYVAGALNAVLALIAFVISKRMAPTAPMEKPASGFATPTGLYGLPRRTVLIMLFATGLVSMGLEVVWIRQYAYFLGNVVYAFAEILGVYLLATFVGSRDYRSWSRTHRPGESASAWSLLALFAVIPVVAVDPSIRLIKEIDGIRLAGVVLFCAMLGFLTPLLVDSWSGGDPDRAGSAYAVNILGCIAGPLVASFGILPWIGERWATLILSVPLFAIAALISLRSAGDSNPGQSTLRNRLKFAAATIAALILFSVSHDFESLFRNGVVRRDYAATVIATGSGMDKLLIVNANGMTNLNPMTKYIAHLPLAFMSRPPKNGLVICFGMGTTFRSMLSWGIPTTAVELVPSVPQVFGYYHADAARVAGSPLALIAIDDGRRFLDGSTQNYDVIVIDPPPPPQATGSSLLYSREFYEVVKRHLSKDGILQTWYPDSASDDPAITSAVAKALIRSFPYVRAFKSYDRKFGIHFLASMEPIPVPTGAVLAARMPSTAAADLVEWGPETHPEKEFDLVVSQEFSVQSLISANPRVPAIEDDQPINEYYLLRRRFHFYR